MLCNSINNKGNKNKFLFRTFKHFILPHILGVGPPCLDFDPGIQVSHCLAKVKTVCHAERHTVINELSLQILIKLCLLGVTWTVWGSGGQHSLNGWLSSSTTTDFLTLFESFFLSIPSCSTWWLFFRWAHRPDVVFPAHLRVGGLSQILQVATLHPSSALSCSKYFQTALLDILREEGWTVFHWFT